MNEEKTTEANTSNSENGKSEDKGIGIIKVIVALSLLTTFMGKAEKVTNTTRNEYAPNVTYADNYVETNSYNQAISHDHKVSCTQADLDNFVVLVLCEAGNQSVECMTGVAATVINRVEANFGSTITSVITAPNQFATYQNGYFCVGGEPVTLNFFYDSQIQNARIAIDAALSGYDPTGPVGGALYFYGLDGLSAEEAAYRQNISQKMQINDLYFYRIWD